MKHDVHIDADSTMDRSLWRAMLRGWRRRCPRCGGGPMMNGYLKVRESCASCGLGLKHHRADDMPAWATILIVGHVIVGGMVALELNISPPVWVHWALWPALTVALALLLLPRLKGVIVALQWAWRMHGFEDDKG